MQEPRIDSRQTRKDDASGARVLSEQSRGCPLLNAYSHVSVMLGRYSIPEPKMGRGDCEKSRVVGQVSPARQTRWCDLTTIHRLGLDPDGSCSHFRRIRRSGFGGWIPLPLVTTTFPADRPPISRHTPTSTAPTGADGRQAVTRCGCMRRRLILAQAPAAARSRAAGAGRRPAARRGPDAAHPMSLGIEVRLAHSRELARGQENEEYAAAKRARTGTP